MMTLEQARNKENRIEIHIRNLRQQIMTTYNDTEENNLAKEIETLKLELFQVRKIIKGYLPDTFKHWMYAAE